MIDARTLALAAGTALLGACFSVPAPAQAQTYPEHSIRLIVPFPAGGATDTMARIVAQALTGKLGQNVVIENQGGAGGTIGARQAAFAAPDGYTLLMVANSTFGTAPLLYKLDYDPVKAFVPVATAAIDRQVMVASPTLPVKTIQQLVQYAKANPGKLNYGSAIGIGPHFVMELFKINAGVDIVHVPYRGGAPMISDLLGGQIQLTVNGKSVLYPHIQAGKMRALAVTAPARWPDLPDVPTMVELGYLEAPYDSLFGVVAPAGTPQPIIEKLNGAINEGLRAPAIAASFAKLGIEAKISTPQEFASFIAEDIPRWAKIVKQTGIKIE
jgi:tripartite-type tricarboxylate transporter receptor subunit TctC